VNAARARSAVLRVVAVGVGVLVPAACSSGSHVASRVSTTTTTSDPARAALSASTSTVTSASPPTPGSTAAPAPTATTAKGVVVVGFGNSVPSGTACSCTNFVSAYAAMVGAGSNTRATVDNDAVSGSTSADVVNLLTKSSVQNQLRAATTVLIMTGANDYNDAFDQVSLGAPAAETYAPVATAVQDNVTTIIDTIHSLNAGAHVVVLDYWAAMEDGAVAAKDYDATAMAASLASTASVNDALAAATKAAKATYVSTLTAFKGPNGTNDDTGLLASDGDHPDAAGHQLIARTIYAVLPNG
jgi:acyl-CoA thioesterase I